MADYPITTEVKIDGVDAPVLVDDLDNGDPTILDGLSFTWGRDTTVDQPDTGACSFIIREQLDRGATQTILDVAHVGANVEIWADAQIPIANSQIMQNTGFPGNGALQPVLYTHQSGTTSSSVTRSTRFGKHAAWIEWVGHTSATWSSTIRFAPLPFPGAGLEPDAWDNLPRILPGQSWMIEMRVWVPRGAHATLQAYAVTTPYKSATTTLCPITGTTTVTGTGAWVTLSGEVILLADFDEDGAWLCPAIAVSSIPGITWAGTNPETWNAQIAAGLVWNDLNRVGVSEVSLITEGPTARNVLVWAGEITSLSGTAAGDNAVTIQVTASDAGAKLANTTIGDDPWDAETVEDRVAKIIDLGNVTDLESVIDAGLQDYMLAHRDVDAQPVLGLLQDIAQSIGGVLWIASHDEPGPFLWLEDPGERIASRAFYLDEGSDLVKIGGNSRQTSFISAMDVLRDPVTWTQDVNAVISSIDVTWLEEVAPEEVGGQVTTEEHTVTLDDAPAIATYGIRKMAISTELTNETDAGNLAARSLTQAGSATWVVSGYQIDTSAITREISSLDYSDRLNMIMDMLDSTRRIGHAVTLIDVPDYTPAGAVADAYVEGGTYTIEDHKWNLDLNLSNAGAQGMSATWQEMDDAGMWEWIDLDRSIRWVDAYGVAGPTP